MDTSKTSPTIGAGVTALGVAQTFNMTAGIFLSIGPHFAQMDLTNIGLNHQPLAIF